MKPGIRGQLAEAMGKATVADVRQWWREARMLGLTIKGYPVDVNPFVANARMAADRSEILVIIRSKDSSSIFSTGRLPLYALRDEIDELMSDMLLSVLDRVDMEAI